jgi:hypothetical protein
MLPNGFQHNGLEKATTILMILIWAFLLTIRAYLLRIGPSCNDSIKKVNERLREFLENRKKFKFGDHLDYYKLLDEKYFEHFPRQPKTVNSQTNAYYCRGIQI